MTDGPIGPFPSGVDRDAYDRLRRRVLWAFPTGLFVVGSTGVLDGERRSNLMTANLVVQVATDPKLVAVSVEAASLTVRLIEAGGSFALSAPRREDRAVVRRFVKAVSEITLDAAGQPSAMAGEPVRTASTGAPILSAAAAWVDCSLRQLIDLGSHRLAIGEVVDAGGVAEGEAPEILRMEDTRMNYGG